MTKKCRLFTACRLFRFIQLSNYRIYDGHGMIIEAKGAAYGTAAHVIGTSRILMEDPLAGAAGSLSLTVAGLITALILPIVIQLI